MVVQIETAGLDESRLLVVVYSFICGASQCSLSNASPFCSHRVSEWRLFNQCKTVKKAGSLNQQISGPPTRVVILRFPSLSERLAQGETGKDRMQ